MVYVKCWVRKILFFSFGVRMDKKIYYFFLMFHFIGVLMQLFIKQEQTHRFQKQTFGYQRGNVAGEG